MTGYFAVNTISNMITAVRPYRTVVLKSYVLSASLVNTTRRISKLPSDMEHGCRHAEQAVVGGRQGVVI